MITVSDACNFKIQLIIEKNDWYFFFCFEFALKIGELLDERGGLHNNVLFFRQSVNTE